MFELDIAKKHISSDPKMVLFTVLAVALASRSNSSHDGNQRRLQERSGEQPGRKQSTLDVSPKENEDYITLYRTLSR